jgi:hypothetical protein
LQKEPPPPTKAYAFLEQEDPEQVWREAHELFHSNLELIDELAYIKMLEQPATETAKLVRRRRPKPLRAGTKVATASTQTQRN